MSTKKIQIIGSLGERVYVQSEEPVDAKVGTLWVDTDAVVDDMSGSVLSVENGGTGHDSIEDTTYTVARYRASALVNTETTPTKNGVINWTYE